MALFSPVRILTAGTAAVALAALAQPAQAQVVSTVCGIQGQAVAPVTIYYDPFAPTGLNQVDIPLVLTRFVGTGTGAKTQQVAFVLTQPASGPNYIVQAQAGGTTYANILYKDGMIPAGLPVLPEVSGEVYYNYGGAAQDASAPINLKVTIPAGVDLSAGGTIDFDIIYVCKGTGGLKNVDTPTRLTGAVKINVNVLSAMQAGYAGSALDFGEIGTFTTASLSTTPQRTAPNNYVRVQSSGPYEISLTSAGGYKLTPGGTGSGNPLQNIPYRLKFLGQTRHEAATTPVSFVCNRAGVGTVAEDHLNLQAQLDEGGVGKLVSPDYRDTLTVTITPRAAGTATTGGECASLSGNFP